VVFTEVIPSVFGVVDLFDRFPPYVAQLHVCGTQSEQKVNDGAKAPQIWHSAMSSKAPVVPEPI
jgi:hypothetical protein